MRNVLIGDFAQKLMLGTAQFGLDYGISNTGGQVSQGEVQRILTKAYQMGIRYLDTAQAYGTSEHVLGSVCQQTGDPFVFSTKLIGPEKWGEEKELQLWIEQSVQGSLARLKVEKLGILFLHRESDLLGEAADPIWKKLKALKEQGLVQKLGISFYSPQALEKLLEKFDLDVVQVPMNLLDRRFFSKRLKDLYREKNVEVHVRSVFLQGFFFFNETNCPEKMRFALPVLKKLHSLATQSQNTLPALSLSYVLQEPLVAKTVVGVTTEKELSEVLNWPYVSMSEDLDRAFAALAKACDSRILDPSKW